MQETGSRDERAFSCRRSFEGLSKGGNVGDPASTSGPSGKMPQVEENAKFKNHTNEPIKLLKTKERSFYTNQVYENKVVILFNQPNI